MRLGDIAHPERQPFGKPLDGVRILALEQQQSLPFATQMLARMGAEVVRVEHPGRGETGRDTLPAMKDPQGRQVGATFLRNNLNKRAIAVDIKSQEGRELILKLAPRFDVLAENFRSGTLARIGLGYEHVSAVHPGVIYASVSGFGADGKSPYSKWAAFAPVAEAMAGFYDFRRPPDRPPNVGGAGPLADTASGLCAALGIVAALRHRDRIGVGQHVDISMYDVMVTMSDMQFNYHSLGREPSVNTPSIYTGFRASDGWFVMMCSRIRDFTCLTGIIGKPEWLTDPRLAGPEQWGERVEDIIRPGVEAWSMQRTKLEACRILNEGGVAVGPCHTIAEVMADEHVRSHNMLVEMPRVDGVAQPVLTSGNPIKLSKMAEGPETRVPWLGEHTDEVLKQELGMDDETIVRLRSQGTIA